MNSKNLTAAVRVAMLDAGLDPDGDLHEQLVMTQTQARRLLTEAQYKMQLGEARGVLTRVLHLAPATESGFNVCPFAGSCADLCIKNTGHMVTGGAARARIAKTVWWNLDRESFLERLHHELNLHEARAVRQGMQAAVRLNGTSDILWERFGVPQSHAGIRFYDYTKVPLEKRKHLPLNYHLTYSVDEQPHSFLNALKYLAAGHNAAMVVSKHGATTRKDSKALIQHMMKQRRYRGFPVIDGDTDDLRFLDAPGSWVLLAAKGPATTDTTGFVRRIGLPRVVA